MMAKKKDIFEEFMSGKDIVGDFSKLGFADWKKSNLDKEAEKIIDKAIRTDDMSGIDKLFGNLAKDLPGSGNPGGKPMRNFGASQRRTPWLNGPEPRQQEILNKALEYVQSVPYKVSLRWIFYRLYQDGFYNDKKGYKNFEILCSRARHTAWNGWHPAVLADETREAIARVFGYPNTEAAQENMASELSTAAQVDIDHFYRQKNYIELWFEARAMTGQFKHYTEDIDLIPMGGQPSISLKWDIAKRLERKASKYELPIIILYFGDEDLAGNQIEETIIEDVSAWSNASFEVVRCGLTKEQVIEYEVPESVDKKGYQWEALSDEAAGKIITQSIEQYIDLSLIDEANDEAQAISEEWREKINEIIEELEKK